MIIPTVAGTITKPLAVPLARYAQIVGVDECAFWGVKTDDQVNADCGIIWTQEMRNRVARYLLEAQEMIEDLVNYPLVPTYIGSPGYTDPEQDLLDEQRFKLRMLTRWCNVIEFGVKTEEIIAADKAPDYLSVDPVVFTVDITGFTIGSLREIEVRYPDSDRVIDPSSLTISGNTLTIEIPRCRTVLESLIDNPVSGLDYDDDSNFLATIDVWHVYTDTTTQATLVANHECSLSCAATMCETYTQSGCVTINKHKIGDINVRPGTYNESTGKWTYPAVVCQRNYDRVRLHYLAGSTSVTQRTESAIVRLAHSRMPEKPCGCGNVENLWKRDNFVPGYLSIERLNCEFGLNDGAWIAWQTAGDMQVMRIRAL